MDTAFLELIQDKLSTVYDPELGINIVDLGLIYDIRLNDTALTIQMTLTTPGCPMHDTIVGGVRRALHGTSGIESIDVDVVWEPHWTPEMIRGEARKQLGYVE